MTQTCSAFTFPIWPPGGSSLTTSFSFLQLKPYNFKPGARVGVGGGFVPSEKHHGKRKSPVVGVRGNDTAINSWDVQ